MWGALDLLPWTPGGEQEDISPAPATQVSRMRDLHLDALVRQYGGDQGRELASCPLVKEFRWEQTSSDSFLAPSTKGGVDQESGQDQGHILPHFETSSQPTKVHKHKLWLLSCALNHYESTGGPERI